MLTHAPPEARFADRPALLLSGPAPPKTAFAGPRFRKRRLLTLRNGHKLPFADQPTDYSDTCTARDRPLSPAPYCPGTERSERHVTRTMYLR